MSILQGLGSYHRILGVRGVLAISSHRLSGWPREVAVRPPGVKTPVRLRVRTSDMAIYNEVLLRGAYDFDIPFLPKTIVDVGANIGMVSIYYANKYPDARIIAVEPEASNFAILLRNIEAYPNIRPIHAALWNRNGEVNVSQNSSARKSFDKWAFVVQESEGVPVRAVTMQTLMSDMQISSIDILKVDIEGAEKEVFESCDWMQCVQCLIIEVHDQIKLGCSAAVDSVAQDFSTLRRGETSFYLRRSHVESSRS
jgi:FkbM family methyltransferase